MQFWSMTVGLNRWTSWLLSGIAGKTDASADSTVKKVRYILLPKTEL